MTIPGNFSAACDACGANELISSPCFLGLEIGNGGLCGSVSSGSSASGNRVKNGEDLHEKVPRVERTHSKAATFLKILFDF